MWRRTYFNRQVLLLAEPSSIFSGAKKTNIYNGANGHFLLCRTDSQKPANGERVKLLGMGYMSHRWFSLTHGLVSWDPPQFLQAAKKLQFWAKFSTMFLIGGLLFYNEKEYRKPKTVMSIGLWPNQIWWGSVRRAILLSACGLNVLQQEEVLKWWVNLRSPL